MRRALAGLLVHMTALAWQRPLAAAPVPVGEQKILVWRIELTSPRWPDR